VTADAPEIRATPACSSWPKPATCRSAGHAAPVRATRAKQPCCPEPSATHLTGRRSGWRQGADLLLPAGRRPRAQPV